MSRALSIVLPHWSIDLRKRRDLRRYDTQNPGKTATQQQTRRRGGAENETGLDSHTSSAPPRLRVEISSSFPAPPLLLVTLHHGVQIVRQCCPRSRGCRVVPGMTLAHARALIIDEHCRVEDDDPAGDLRSLHRLANWALRWSPVVAPDPPDGLFINITGCQQVFRGEKRLLKRIARD